MILFFSRGVSLNPKGRRKYASGILETHSEVKSYKEKQDVLQSALLIGRPDQLQLFRQP